MSGQGATEYLLLMCSVLMLTQVAYGFLRRYLPMLTERVVELMLDAAFKLAAPV